MEQVRKYSQEFKQEAVQLTNRQVELLLKWRRIWTLMRPCWGGGGGKPDGAGRKPFQELGCHTIKNSPASNGNWPSSLASGIF